MSKLGPANKKPGSEPDKRQTGQRVARSAARAATTWLRIHDPSRVSVAVRPWRAPGFGPGVVPLALIPLVPINTPLGFQSRRYTEFKVVFHSML